MHLAPLPLGPRGGRRLRPAPAPPPRDPAASGEPGPEDADVIDALSEFEKALAASIAANAAAMMSASSWGKGAPPPALPLLPLCVRLPVLLAELSCSWCWSGRTRDPKAPLPGV